MVEKTLELVKVVQGLPSEVLLKGSILEKIMFVNGMLFMGFLSFSLDCCSLASEFSRGDSYDRNDEVDIAVDALNPGAVFSKTKAFEVMWGGGVPLRRECSKL